jgi:hypothetical protein
MVAAGGGPVHRGGAGVSGYAQVPAGAGRTMDGSDCTVTFAAPHTGFKLAN